MATIFFRIRKKLEESFTSLKNSWPIAVLLIYSFGGAALLRVVDQVTPADPDDRMALSPENCLSAQTYWGAVYYTNTVYTSIGWGNIYPCSWAGKLVSVVYILCGIPLVLLVLNLVGQVFTTAVDAGWGAIFPTLEKCIKKLSEHTASPDKQSSAVVDDMAPKARKVVEVPKVPLGCGLLLTGVWVLISALYFSETENWRFFDSLYFCMIAFTTVGFGDFYPSLKEDGSVLSIFFFLFVGLALVSMEIQLVQEHIAKFYQQIQEKILEQYRQRIAQGEDGNEDESIDVKQIAFSSWISKLMSDNQLDQLIKQGDQLSRMRVRAVQATVDMLDEAVDNTVLMQDKETDTGIIMRNRSVDCTRRSTDTTTQHSPELKRRNQKATQEQGIQAKTLGWPRPPSPPKTNHWSRVQVVKAVVRLGAHHPDRTKQSFTTTTNSTFNGAFHHIQPTSMHDKITVLASHNTAEASTHMDVSSAVSPESSSYCDTVQPTRYYHFKARKRDDDLQKIGHSVPAKPPRKRKLLGNDHSQSCSYENVRTLAKVRRFRLIWPPSLTNVK